MTTKLFPAAHNDFLEFVKRNKQVLEGDAASYGVSVNEVMDLAAAFNEYVNTAKEQRAARDTARVARVRKNEARKKLETILGGYFRRARASGNVSDLKLIALGLKPHDKIRTPVKAPTDAPEFFIEKTQAAHIIKFWEAGSSRRRRKPRGAVGVEIYVSLDPNQNNEAAYVLKTIASRSPHLVAHARADIGKEAHYYLRWLSRRGEKSEPSRPLTATITS